MKELHEEDDATSGGEEPDDAPLLEDSGSEFDIDVSISKATGDYDISREIVESGSRKTVRLAGGLTLIVLGLVLLVAILGGSGGGAHSTNPEVTTPAATEAAPKHEQMPIEELEEEEEKQKAEETELEEAAKTKAELAQTPKPTPEPTPKPTSATTPTNPIAALPTADITSREMQTLAAKLHPRPWNISLTPHQFLHMHHMKTGGTSVDGLISCALRRYQSLTNTPVPYGRVSECGGGVQRCFSDRNKCSSADTSSVYSFCASLNAVDYLGWGEADKFTILRDPIDRAWSMYRFSLNGCYSCKPLDEIYAMLDNGTELPGICGDQLVNHQTDNMLSRDQREMENSMSEEEITDHAIANLERFTLVGHTGALAESIAMIQYVFPFMGKNLSALEDGPTVKHDGSPWVDPICELKHANAGSEPTCGTRELTPELKEIILRHNQRDAQLYQAALKLYEKQKQILAPHIM